MCFLCQEGPGYLWGEIKANDLRTAVRFRTGLETGVDDTGMQVAWSPKDNYDMSASVFVVQFNGFMSLTI